MTEALMKAAEAREAKVASLLHRAVAMVALLAAKVRGLVGMGREATRSMICVGQALIEDSGT